MKKIDYPTILDDCSNNVVSRTNYGCRIVEGSVNNVSVIFNERFDMVYHLACFVGPVGVLKHSGKMAFEILEEDPGLTKTPNQILQIQLTS